MSEKSPVIDKIIALQHSLSSQNKEKGSSGALKRLNKLMSNIKRVGFIEKIQLNGEEGRYLIIDGHSWQSVCQDLHLAAESSFVLWEENEFLSFLQSHFISLGKNRPLKRSEVTHR